MRAALAILPMLLVAGCGDGAGSNDSAPAAKVAAVQAPAGKNWTETVEVTPEGGYRMGNPNAPIKLIEFGSRTCPACAAFSRDAATPLEQTYIASGKVSYEFRDFMLHGPPDLAAALIGRCGGTGPFFPLLTQTYATQAETLDRLQKAPPEMQTRLAGQAPGVIAIAWAEQAGYIDFAKQRGIPEAKARQCLTDQKAIDALVKLTDDSSKSGLVTGTPTFLLNGEKVDTISWADIEAALKRVGA